MTNEYVLQARSRTRRRLSIVKDGVFAMLTTPPAPDIAPYHDRQIVVLPAGAGVHWLKLSAAEDLILQPSPAGALAVKRVWPD